MLTANFRGRKNARRIKAVAQQKYHLSSAEKNIQLLEKIIPTLAKNSEERVARERLLPQMQDYVQRVKKAITNTEAKIMDQFSAEAVRTKKNRQGFSRVR